MKSKSQKLLCGVGLNDADYPVKPRNGERCKFHLVWSNMISRCYSDSYHSRYKTYVGCTVCDEWLTFSTFKSWMETQDWRGKELDKDLLVVGNKVYSPTTCRFITRELNQFMNTNRQHSELKSTGVHINKSGSFVATIKHNGELVYLGSFHCEDSAKTAYDSYKVKIARELAAAETDVEIHNAILNRYASNLGDI